ncbi:alpha/beta hydrolase fold domain-containing protein [Pseudonocardia sp. C8]|uniref:alpha/beta hydrolase n=1 Tax=Pseudonocardia sp. C8 TaxID=2762759 RepID=UPI0016430802|nr:alpha/beta hydrolase fold domain-containing protein [Pseudonocardia sp. C8]MBC3192977.1 alpha/beta hydrolase fold domain-containing protein [Pseudonocardia sp. C8]
MAAPDDILLPADLLRFQTTLAPPAGRTALDVLAAADPYTNQNADAGLLVGRRVPIRQVAGWDVTADVYRPATAGPLPVLVYLHGGGWVLGAPSTHRRLARDIAGLGLVVVVVDYRRAPRHRFPAAVDDTTDAIEWARRHASTWGGDPDRMVVAGDSAGANLAAAALALGAEGCSAAVLAYGIYDVHRALPLLSGLVGGPDPDSQLYLDPVDARRLVDDPRLHPERHCAGFPPTLVLVGRRDPLVGESRALAKQLTDRGVVHSYVEVEDAPHGFLQMPTESWHTDGLAVIGEFLTDVLPPTAHPGAGPGHARR